jgi:hypothetical protein
LGSGLEEEVGYGKSPEWVEVDGHIVSKGVASLAREHGQDPRSGSVLSLPYSSRTQLTYNRYKNYLDSSKKKIAQLLLNPYDSLRNNTGGLRSMRDRDIKLGSDIMNLHINIPRMPINQGVGSLKWPIFNCAFAKYQIKRPHITMSACTYNLKCFITKKNLYTKWSSLLLKLDDFCSSSSCQSGSGTRSRGSSGKKCREDLYKIETENEYETIPADISAAFRFENMNLHFFKKKLDIFVIFIDAALRCVYTCHFRMHFLHCVAISK